MSAVTRSRRLITPRRMSCLKSTKKYLTASVAKKQLLASRSRITKAASSVRLFTAGSKKRKTSRPSATGKKPIARTPFPNRLDPRSYITKGGRVRLYGADYQALKLAAYERSKRGRAYGVCECGCLRPAYWHHDLAPSLAARGELSHKKHGSRKSDELSEVLWMRHECHEKSHNAGGKPVPAKEN